MTREILCKACGRSHCHMLGLDPATGGERDIPRQAGVRCRVLVGILKPKLGAARLRFICDGDSTVIKPGDVVYAVTWSKARDGQPARWEEEYLDAHP